MNQEIPTQIGTEKLIQERILVWQMEKGMQENEATKEYF